MSGGVGTLGECTKLEENFICGVVKRHSGRSDTKDTDNKRYQRLKMPHKECLEVSGHWVRIQNSRKIQSVVWVWGILGVPIQEIPTTRDTED